MAHTPETKHAVRQSYVYERLSLAEAGSKWGISYATAQAWKRAAKANGDNWDKARTAGRMAAGTLGDMTQEIMEDFALLFKSTMTDIKDGDFNGLEKAEAISSLSDSYTKTMKAAAGGNPEIAKLSVAMEVLSELAAFIKKEYPDDLPVLIKILEPFGVRVSEVFS